MKIWLTLAYCRYHTSQRRLDTSVIILLIRYGITHTHALCSLHVLSAIYFSSSFSLLYSSLFPALYIYASYFSIKNLAECTSELLQVVFKTAVDADLTEMVFLSPLPGQTVTPGEVNDISHCYCDYVHFIMHIVTNNIIRCGRRRCVSQDSRNHLNIFKPNCRWSLLSPIFSLLIYVLSFNSYLLYSEPLPHYLVSINQRILILYLSLFSSFDTFIYPWYLTLS